MTEYVFGLGSNSGDRRGAVEEAVAWLASFLSDFECSSVYETLPVGHSGSCYMNAVAVGWSELGLDELEALCKRHELECGRDSAARKEGRVPVDIDIVIAGGAVLRPKDYQATFFRIGYLPLRHSADIRTSVF